MYEVQHDLLFATLRIAVTGTAASVSLGEIDTMAPALPIGMRIEGIRTETLTAKIMTGEYVSILVVAEPLAGWTSSVESGEWLDALVFTHSTGAVGAVAMRDADWFCQRYPLAHIDGAHTINIAKGFSATYRATAPTLINIQAAFAWLMKPETVQEALSPWYAVDKALHS